MLSTYDLICFSHPGSKSKRAAYNGSAAWTVQKREDWQGSKEPSHHMHRENVSLRWSIVTWAVQKWDSGTHRKNLPVARMAQGMLCARLSLSMPLPSFISLTPVVPHGVPLPTSDCSAAKRWMPSTVQPSPTPCPQNRKWDVSSELKLLPSGLPAK